MATKELVTTRTVDNATPSVGSEVMFTLTMVNDGSSDATGVELTDALPSGYTHVSDAASVGTYVPATGLWTIGALGNGVTATLAIRATVNASGTYLNTATAAGDQNDPTTVGDDLEETTTPTATTELVTTKTVENATPSVGSEVVFTLTEVNDGPSG